MVAYRLYSVSDHLEHKAKHHRNVTCSAGIVLTPDKIGTSKNFGRPHKYKSTKSPRNTPRQSIKSKDKKQPVMYRERAKYSLLRPSNPRPCLDVPNTNTTHSLQKQPSETTHQIANFCPIQQAVKLGNAASNLVVSHHSLKQMFSASVPCREPCCHELRGEQQDRPR